MNTASKLTAFRRLSDDRQAAPDLRLLSRLQPAHPQLARFAASPRRHAGDILFALLDVATEQQIADNRRPAKAEPAKKQPAPKMDKADDKPEAKKKSRKKKSIPTSAGKT